MPSSAVRSEQQVWAHIAIVWDERNVLTSLRMALEAEEFAVETYEDPLRALPKLIAVPPRRLILSGRMPCMHGLEFDRRLRAYSRAPVGCMSSGVDEIEAQPAMEGLPAERYLASPFSQRQVNAVIRELLWPGVIWRSPRRWRNTRSRRPTPVIRIIYIMESAGWIADVS